MLHVITHHNHNTHPRRTHSQTYPRLPPFASFRPAKHAHRVAGSEQTGDQAPNRSHLLDPEETSTSTMEAVWRRLCGPKPPFPHSGMVGMHEAAGSGCPGCVRAAGSEEDQRFAVFLGALNMNLFLHQPGFNSKGILLGLESLKLGGWH